MSNLHRVKRNVIFINRANDLKHEMKKLEICYMLKSFITEAECNKTKRRHDAVDLITGTIYEVVHKHEKDEDIFNYRKEGIIPVLVGDTIKCKICGFNYPKRNKSEVCSICAKKSNAKNAE